jgi:coproporphyrinogen III oxidase
MSERPSRELCAQFARELQESITARLASLDGSGFTEDSWQRPGGGGGRTRVLLEGALFEKAGVSYSEVHGELTEEFARQLHAPGASASSAGAGPMEAAERAFFAAGVSLVLHPRSPRVPTVHANFRYLEKGSSWWFGGGSDLTPYRLCEEDPRHFHGVWKSVCDRHDASYYPRFKKWCDEYFYLPHRKETRGVGGIFFDYLTGDAGRLFAFWKDAGRAFLDAYVPIVERRRGESYTQGEREHQLLRRGRYAEFNLLYDRGTVFGLKTGGRVESILMSLPPLARWGYDSGAAPGNDASGSTPEAALIKVLERPREWV